MPPLLYALRQCEGKPRLPVEPEGARARRAHRNAMRSARILSGAGARARRANRPRWRRPFGPAADGRGEHAYAIPAKRRCYRAGARFGPSRRRGPPARAASRPSPKAEGLAAGNRPAPGSQPPPTVPPARPPTAGPHVVATLAKGRCGRPRPAHAMLAQPAGKPPARAPAAVRLAAARTPRRCSPTGIPLRQKNRPRPRHARREAGLSVPCSSVPGALRCPDRRFSPGRCPSARRLRLPSRWSRFPAHRRGWRRRAPYARFAPPKGSSCLPG